MATADVNCPLVVLFHFTGMGFIDSFIQSVLIFFFFFNFYTVICLEIVGHNLEDNECFTLLFYVYILWIWLSISVGCYLYYDCMTLLDDQLHCVNHLYWFKWQDNSFCILAVPPHPCTHCSPLVFYCHEDGVFTPTEKKKQDNLHIQVFCPLLINELLLTFPTGLYITMFNKARLFLSSSLYKMTTV